MVNTQCRTTEKQNRLLIQFAKAPIKGTVKTRLQTVLSPDDALQVHLVLLKQTALTLLHSRADSCQLVIAGCPDAEFIGYWQRQGMQIDTQVSGDLGTRMRIAINKGLEQFHSVVLVGSDCPVLSTDRLNSAFTQLEEGADLVLNPAEDGGYVLIGARRPLLAELLEGIDWGSERVCQQTSNNAGKLGYTTAMLPVLWDIDRPEDLLRWQIKKEIDHKQKNQH